MATSGSPTSRTPTTGTPAFVPPMSRKVIAVLALIGCFVSLYLLLYDMGVFGVLLCGEGGGCETVQASRYARFLGLPVPLWGVGGYLSLLGLALIGVQPSAGRDRRVAIALLAFGTVAFLFSMYLTAVEAWVLRAWCRWCLASAAVATLIFLASLPELGRIRGPRRERES
ncbi:MAG: vitamin K epoxide reductase family protein [Longimicrobiales bacterium]